MRQIIKGWFYANLLIGLILAYSYIGTGFTLSDDRGVSFIIMTFMSGFFYILSLPNED